MPPTPPTPSRRERKKVETRKRIFSEALNLFLEKGFDATTVEEIAEQADVGKGTVFNYFPKKTEFLIAAYSEWVGVIQERLGPVESWQGTVRSQLTRVFDFLTDLSVKHRILSRQIIFENLRQTHVRIAKLETETVEGIGGEHVGPEALLLLEKMVRQVVQKGKVRAEIRPDADEAQAASLLAAAAFHTIVRGLVLNTPAPAIKMQLASQIDIIFTGLNP